MAEMKSKLEDRVRSGVDRYVSIDPDGSIDIGLLVIVEHSSGVIYGVQCGGTAMEERHVRGYIVPVGGIRSTVDEDLSRIEPAEFRRVFHDGDVCRSDWRGAILPIERREQLAQLVREVPFWSTAPGSTESDRTALELDSRRLDQIVEAWVPVQTPDGPGILVWDNCD
jgi:hypothetical protein